MRDAKSVRLEEVVDVLDHRGRTPKKLGGDFSRSGVPVLSAKSIRDGRLTMENLRFVSEELFEKWMPEKLRAGDVLLTSEAPLGVAAYLRDDGPYCLGQRLFGLRAHRHVLHDRYLYYSLLSKPVQQQLHARASGTTAQGIRQSELVKVTLEIPPLDEQRAIAAVLGALDDKVELNRRIAHNLWEQARTLYGGLTNGDAFGHVTWRSDTVGDVVELLYGRPLPERDRVRGGVAVYGSNGQVGWHNERIVEGPGVVVGRKGNPGTVTWVHDDFYPIDTTFYVVRQQPVSLAYLFFALAEQDLASFAADSAVPGLNRNLVASNELRVPDEAAQQRFDEIVTGQLRKVRQSEDESRVLSDLRDLLLRRLISGELRIRDAEPLIEAST